MLKHKHDFTEFPKIDNKNESGNQGKLFKNEIFLANQIPFDFKQVKFVEPVQRCHCSDWFCAIFDHVLL